MNFRLISLISTLLTAFLLSALAAPEKQAASPGSQIFSPTRIQWAALELQSRYGKNFMDQVVPMTITYIVSTEKETIICLIQYTQDFPAAAMKTGRKDVEGSFEKYKKEKGWDWLKLNIEESPLPWKWPGP